MTTERTSLYLSVQIKRELAQAAKRLGRSQTQLVNDALDEYLANLEKPKFAFIGTGADTVVTGRNSEAWLRKNWSRPRKK